MKIKGYTVKGNKLHSNKTGKTYTTNNPKKLARQHEVFEHMKKGKK